MHYHPSSFQKLSLGWTNLPSRPHLFIPTNRGSNPYHRFPQSRKVAAQRIVPRTIMTWATTRFAMKRLTCFWLFVVDAFLTLALMIRSSLLRGYKRLSTFCWTYLSILYFINVFSTRAQLFLWIVEDFIGRVAGCYGERKLSCFVDLYTGYFVYIEGGSSLHFDLNR